DKIKKTLKGVKITHRPDSCKLLCDYRGKQVKIEVNQTKRGIVGGGIITMPLCEKAQKMFGLYSEANIVPLSLLYGGKIAAALSRQHPRDLFDVKYMDVNLASLKHGFIFCLLGSDRPIYESFAPHLIDQREALLNQFVGMTNIEFDYSEFEETRRNLIKSVNDMLTEVDKSFLIAFESGEPNWEVSEYDSFKNFPSVQWKQLNIQQFKQSNPAKWQEGIVKLKQVLNVKEYS
ncbi:MAG: nucleotidyl transferase AbiEii/AbiGii toxin family protein, partial [Bacteroidia bacterium]|nr:nucleotidyl transferase AbiEii/AbiGii toxin family protein [Bacteroidia bacterium]